MILFLKTEKISTDASMASVVVRTDDGNHIYRHKQWICLFGNSRFVHVFHFVILGVKSW